MIRMRRWRDILINDWFCFDQLEETWRDDGSQSNDVDSEGARILPGKLTWKFYLSNSPVGLVRFQLNLHGERSKSFRCKLVCLL